MYGIMEKWIKSLNTFSGKEDATLDVYVFNSVFCYYQQM
jgi:hypothetical protein